MTRRHSDALWLPRGQQVGDGPGTAELRVPVAGLAVAREGQQLVTIGLGSCVAIVLHDTVAGVGGLAHVLLPSPCMSRERGNPARFPCTAVPELLGRMAGLGAGHERVVAWLVGGASMFRSLLSRDGVELGPRNVAAARAALGSAGVTLLAEDTGGEHGRSVYFDVSSGLLRVRSIVAGDRVL